MNAKIGSTTISEKAGRWFVSICVQAEPSKATVDLLLKMGVELKVIQAILGHPSIVVTANIYGHVLLEVQGEAMEMGPLLVVGSNGPCTPGERGERNREVFRCFSLLLLFTRQQRSSIAGWCHHQRTTG